MFVFGFFFLLIFFSKKNQNLFSGRFYTSGSMIPLLVPEISPCDGFCDEDEERRNWVF